MAKSCSSLEKLNNRIDPIVKHVWNVLYNYSGLLNATAYHLCQHEPLSSSTKAFHNLGIEHMLHHFTH